MAPAEAAIERHQDAPTNTTNGDGVIDSIAWKDV